MKTYGDNFFVRYEKGSIRNYDLGSGVVIEIAAECNMDIRGNSDQIGVIECVPDGHDFFKAGDKVLTHYLSSSDGNAMQVNGEVLYKLKGNELFAKINEDGELEPAMDVYFCKQVTTVSKTDSGIYLSSSPEVEEKMKLKVTHAPESVNHIWADDRIKVGDIIMSQDNYQYKFTYNKEEYVKIEQKFIVGVFLNEEESTTIN